MSILYKRVWHPICMFYFELARLNSFLVGFRLWWAPMYRIPSSLSIGVLTPIGTYMEKIDTCITLVESTFPIHKVTKLHLGAS